MMVPPPQLQQGAPHPGFYPQGRPPIAAPPPNVVARPSTNGARQGAPHGQPGHLEQDCARCRALMERVIAESKQSAAAHRQEQELKATTQESREDEELRRAMEESLAISQIERSKEEELERQVLEQSRREAEAEEEERRRRTEANTQAALERSRALAEEEERRRRAEVELEREIEARVLEESRIEQEREWRRREEEEQQFLQAIEAERRGEEDMWQRMQHEARYAPAFQAYETQRRQSVRRKQRQQSYMTELRTRPLPPPPPQLELESREAVQRAPNAHAEELLVPPSPAADLEDLLAEEYNPFGDDAEAPPTYDETVNSSEASHEQATTQNLVAPEPQRPPLPLRMSSPGPGPVAAPMSSEGSQAHAPRSSFLPQPRSPLPPPIPRPWSAAPNLPSTSTLPLPAPAVAPVITPQRTPSPGLSIASTHPTESPRQAQSRPPRGPRLHALLQPLAARPQLGAIGDRPVEIETESMMASPLSPMRHSSSGETHGPSLPSSRPSSLRSGIFAADSPSSTGLHSPFPTHQDSDASGPSTQPLESPGSARPSISSSTAPRFEQKTPQGVDWGYSSYPFEARLRATPDATSSVEGKEFFPSTITLRAHSDDTEGNANYFVVRAQTWKALLRALAWFGNSRIEAGPEEIADAVNSKGKSPASKPTAGSCRLRIELEFITPHRWDVPLEAVEPLDAGVGNPSAKPARVAVCLSLVQSRTPDMAAALVVKNRALDTRCIASACSRRSLILPSRPPTLPVSVVDLAQHMHAAYAFSAACPSAGSSSYGASSPRDLASAIEKHDVKYFNKRRKEAAARLGPQQAAEAAEHDDPTGLQMASTAELTEEPGTLSRMKGRIKKKILGREESAVDDDLSTWITPFGEFNSKCFSEIRLTASCSQTFPSTAKHNYM